MLEICVCVFVLTGWESVVRALRFLSRGTDGFQVHAVVGAAGDASHQAVGVQGVAFGFSSWGHECSYEGASTTAGRPGHIGHGLGDLGHVHVRGAARTFRIKLIRIIILYGLDFQKFDKWSSFVSRIIFLLKVK